MQFLLALFPAFVRSSFTLKSTYVDRRTLQLLKILFVSRVHCFIISVVINQFSLIQRFISSIFQHIGTDSTLKDALKVSLVASRGEKNVKYFSKQQHHKPFNTRCFI